MGKTIRINCMIKAKPETREQVLELAKELVAFSKKDAGNIDYDIFASQTDSMSMMIFETWTDQASLDVHSASPHFTRIVPQLQALSEMSIEVF